TYPTGHTNKSASTSRIQPRPRIGDEEVAGASRPRQVNSRSANIRDDRPLADPRPAGDARPPSPDHGAVGRPARNRPPTLAAPAGSPDHGQQRPGPGGAYGVRHAAGRALAALAAASLLVGAYLAVRFTVPTKLVGRIMGFGAGALVAALAYELIPDSY